MTDLAHEHTERLLAYFDGQGFERWSAIYGEAEVSRIRRTIRQGHARMLALAEQWLVEATGSSRGLPERQPHVLDAGCGTGLLSVALARRGLRVSAVDLAPQMVGAAEQAVRAAGLAGHVDVRVSDVESLAGQYDAVACLDVLVHYPAPSFAQICRALAARSRGALVFTYAPREPLLAALHWLGGRFPTNHRRTAIQMIAPRFVLHTLAACGMHIRRSTRISQGFYHVTLVEAGPADRH
ncbi:MAG: magnesium protoporphyrin IX methyltransferase [Kouleothrix sp.]|jgi:magnesium-protoporphyrin O-methyltransferase|nr:magnesium protoporphyrin IX methyltransferase [Kouleothrix sp.]